MNSYDTLFWPEERWRRLQAERLTGHLKHAGGTRFYANGNLDILSRKLAGKPERFQEILAQLPLTTKDQLARAGRGAAAVQREQVAEWVCTSGSLGKPLDVPLTRGDLERLAENEAAALALAGIGPGDLVIFAVGMERLFVAGMAYWLGARKIGATCVRAGPHLTQQAGLLKEMVDRFRSNSRGKGKTFVIAVPSFLTGVERVDIDGIVAIGEPIRAELTYNVLGGFLHEQFHCPVMSTYATTEICTTFAEGSMCRGGHLNPFLGIVEVLDDAGQTVEEGIVGEIVVTPLGVEGMPLVRFRTGDMAVLMREKCACGRTTPRVGPIVGRRQQLLKVRGTSIYPGTILEAMRALASVVECIVVAEEAAALSDRVTVYLELRNGEENVRGEIEARLRSVLRVMPEVCYVEGEEMRKMQAGTGSRKVVRFIDRRAGRA